MSSKEVTEYIYKRFSVEEGYPKRINGTREDLAKLFAELGYSTGAEIGVREGLFSMILCQNANPELKLYCIDPWAPYSENPSPRKQRRIFHTAIANLSPYKKVMLVRKVSEAAMLDVADGALDFVYIDGDHSAENVKKDINGWYPKVKLGGIVSGHDYFINRRWRRVQVLPVVDAFVRDKDLELFATTEQFPSWFVVKP